MTIAPWVLPFFLNDFGFAALQGRPVAFYAFDYTLRAGILWSLWRRVKTTRERQDLRWTLPPQTRDWLWTPALTAAGIFQAQFLDPRIAHFLTTEFPQLQWHLFSFPSLNSTPWKIWDLTVGLALVAISEESVFRGLADRRLKGGALQSVLFATMHWGSGTSTVFNAWLWCLLPTWSARRTGSIWPAVVGHYFSDLVAFW